MCVVIDICCVAKVFDPRNQHHQDYAPVFNWVTHGNGKMIYGGTKYGNELRRTSRYFRLITELRRGGRAVKVRDDRVDTIAADLKAIVNDPHFDDEHIAALVIASRCCVVCTDDNAAIYYLKQKHLYLNRGMKRPRIYRSLSNSKLCCDRNVENYEAISE